MLTICHHDRHTRLEVYHLDILHQLCNYYCKVNFSSCIVCNHLFWKSVILFRNVLYQKKVQVRVCMGGWVSEWLSEWERHQINQKCSALNISCVANMVESLECRVMRQHSRLHIPRLEVWISAHTKVLFE